MAGAALRDQAFVLLAAANNHGDLAVKLSSLKQAKNILLSLEPSFAVELLPFLTELQSSPEYLVRKSLVEVIEEIALKAVGISAVLLPALLTLLKDDNSVVARQSIVSGINVFCSVLEAMAQFHQRGKFERWLEELWMWMVKFKDSVFPMALEPGSVGTKLLALKFLEIYVLLFTSDTNDSETSRTEGSRWDFNISWLGGHPVLDPVMLMSEANRTLGILLDLLRSGSSLPGTLTIAVVNCLAAIARKRPLHYTTILSALLDFDPSYEMVKGCHAASIQYSLRTAFLGFLRCTYSPTMESRDKLLRALRALNAGDAADQAIRQVDKLMKNTERALRDAQLSKDDQPPNQLPFSGDSSKKRSMPQDNDEATNNYEMAKRSRYGSNTHSTSPVQVTDSGQDFVSVNGIPPTVPLLDSELTPEEQMIAMIGALLAEGERGAESLEILISQIHPDLLADIVITNMKHLPKAPPSSRLGNLPDTQQIGFLGIPAKVVAQSAPVIPSESPVTPAQLTFSSTSITCTSPTDMPTVNNFPSDSKRDPRRDPRRLDPRRLASPVAVPSVPVVEGSGAIQSEIDSSLSSSKPVSVPGLATVENPVASLTSKIKIENKILESPLVFQTDKLSPKEEVRDGLEEIFPVSEVNATSDLGGSPIGSVDEDSAMEKWSDVAASTGIDTPSFLESDQHSPSASNTSLSEETGQDLPVLPSYVHLSEEQQRNVKKLAVERIIMSYKHLKGADSSLTRMALIARLVAQVEIFG